jgi:molybdenum cofactor cytidylyltransferase
MPPKVCAIIPAAGRSRRMGRCKPLLPLGERPVIRHLVDTLLEVGLDAVIVVTGAEGAAIDRALAGLAVTLVDNPEPESDMAGSLRLGLRASPDDATALLVCLADHPLVSAATIRVLLARHRAEPATIFIPTCDGRSGHPVLLPRPVADELFTLSTLRDVVHRSAQRCRRLEVADPGVTLDMDTPDDYRRALALWQATVPTA